jgi:hypothetical protein
MIHLVSPIKSSVTALLKPLARMLRHLAARGCINETGSDEYVSTNFSKALNIPTIGDGYPVL